MSEELAIGLLVAAVVVAAGLQELRVRRLAARAAAAGRQLAERTAELEQLRLRLRDSQRQIAELDRNVQDTSNLDRLTRLVSRRRADELLLQEWRRASRGTALSVIFVDVDHFRSFNRSYGQKRGDECLQQLAGAFGLAVGRAADVVARWEGQRFLILLPETPTAGATRVGENVRAGVEALTIPNEKSPHRTVTVSVGVATAAPREEGTGPAALLEAAEAALAEAKRGGRNRLATRNLEEGQPA